jgi:hypothetical protein
VEQYLPATHFVSNQSSAFCMSTSHPLKPNDLCREQWPSKMRMLRIWVVEMVVKILNFLKHTPKEEFVFLSYRCHTLQLILCSFIFRNCIMIIDRLVIIDGHRVVFGSQRNALFIGA